MARMRRLIFGSVVVVCGTFAAPASAEPVGDNDVPGMHYGVEALAPCPDANITHYAFGRGTNGALMVCHMGNYGKPYWDTVGGRDLNGIQQPGTSCSVSGMLAEASDGRPVGCSEGSWVTLP
jgi:hypothetical protein